jgi:hypothetical protein
VPDQLREEVDAEAAAERARREGRARELAEQALVERSAGSGERVPGELTPGQPFVRLG